MNDCGGLPQGSNEISLTDFVKLIDAIPSLKIMTISPHLESKTGYSRLRALLDRLTQGFCYLINLLFHLY